MREMNPPCHLLCLYCLHLKRFFSFFFFPVSEGITRGWLLNVPGLQEHSDQQCWDENRGEKLGPGIKQAWGDNHAPPDTLECL